MGRGDHPETFLLKALWVGWWVVVVVVVGGGGGGLRVLLVFGFGANPALGLGLRLGTS